MTLAAHFHHQPYSDAVPTSPHFVLDAEVCPPVGTRDYYTRLEAAGVALREANIGAVYLAHGAFVGSDALGMLNELGRVFPSAGEVMRRVSKQMVDRLTSDSGNYTEAFASTLEQAINACAGEHIPVRLFEWSSENNHIGRADGAIRLFDELASLELPAGKRVLLWGHSHAGNVFALLTQLLASDRQAVEEFFDAANVYYRWPVLGCVDIPMWRRARLMLTRGENPLVERPLDFVTFGTPIRYGWNPHGYSQLLHFVFHRPSAGLPAYQAPFPPTAERVLRAVDGDYVQQLGIAGTNIPPSIFSWRCRWAEGRLSRLLQREVAETKLLDRFRAGSRVAEQGTTLLVDYGAPPARFADHCAGHALYTKRDWLLFHAEEVARRFYAA